MAHIRTCRFVVVFSNINDFFDSTCIFSAQTGHSQADGWNDKVMREIHACIRERHWRPRVNLWRRGKGNILWQATFEPPDRARKRHSRLRGNLFSAPPAFALTTSTLISRLSCLAPGNPPCLGFADNRPCIVVKRRKMRCQTACDTEFGVCHVWTGPTACDWSPGQAQSAFLLED
jgi:hypothetical protein